MAERVVITGGAGFIGSHLARRCVAEGLDVHLIVRPSSSLHRLAGEIDRLTVHTADLGDEPRLRALLARIAPDRVFHLAARTRGADAADTLADARNLLLLLQLLAEQDRPPSVVVRTGSIAEYGTGPLPYREDQHEEPETPYAVAHVIGTEQLRRLASMLTFPVVTVRLALVYGPGQSEDFLIPAMIRRCLEGQPLTVRHPDDRRDLLHIDDAVEGLMQLSEAKLMGHTVVNLATGEAPSMREAAKLVLAATGADPALVTLSDTQPGRTPSELRAAPDLAQSLVGWKAALNLADGIEKTVSAMRSHDRIAA